MQLSPITLCTRVTSVFSFSLLFPYANSYFASILQAHLFSFFSPPPEMTEPPRSKKEGSVTSFIAFPIGGGEGTSIFLLRYVCLSVTKSLFFLSFFFLVHHRQFPFLKRRMNRTENEEANLQSEGRLYSLGCSAFCAFEWLAQNEL